MVILTQAILDEINNIPTCKATTDHFNGIPEIDLFEPNAKTLIVKACQEFGFFKLINHGVSLDCMNNLEAEASKFFNLPQSEKDKYAPPNLFGYGNKTIGHNGDVGWVEYLLFSIIPEIKSEKDISNIFSGNLEHLWSLVYEYVSCVKSMGCKVLEMIADELKIGSEDVFSKLLSDEKSDSCFRLNHYPPNPCPELQALDGKNLVGFGAHTDPQIISILRSNNTTGFQIALNDGTWVSVAPDPSAFFINVGDTLQVLTNGRFKSVKHRVLSWTKKPRFSMIYFGGPPLSAKIAPLPCLMEKGEESLYEEFTWSEYKKSAFKTKLGDNRLAMFEKKLMSKI